MKKNVLGVNIDDVSKEEALGIIEGWLKDSGQARMTAGKIITTPGPEFILTAQKDQEFKNILNSADLAVAESFGLQLYCGFKNRVPGVDLMLAICGLAEKSGQTVGMLGNPNTGLAAKELYRLFPKLKITYAYDNPEADRLIGDYEALRYVDILFVGIGHPRQEKFLSRIKANKKFKVGMGVGGSFDEVSGKRVPAVFQKLGLKWLGRFILEPKRYKRIFNATIIFPITYFISKFT